MSDPPDREQSDDREALKEKIVRKVDRRIKAQKEKNKSVWFGLGMFGLIGWSVAIPTLVGVAFGLWLDRVWPSQASWTLTFLIIGVAIGCWHAWYWIRQESERD